MKHTEPLRKNYEFARVYKKGRFLVSGFVVLHYFKRRGTAGPNRLGVTVSIILTGRRDEPPPTFAQINKEVGRLLRKAGIRRDAVDAPTRQPTGADNTDT